MTTIRFPLALRAVACALTLLLSVPTLARAEESIQFDIASQPLVSALKAFAEQSDMQLLYAHEAVKNANANAVIGKHEKREALAQLLHGTDLEIIYTADNAATIRAKGTQPESIHTTAIAESMRLAQAEGGTPLLQLAMAATGQAPAAEGQAAPAQRAEQGADKRDESSFGEEVTVFGTREEGYVSNSITTLGPLGSRSLLETPVSVYVMSRHLIENLQVISPDALFKVNPVIQFTNPQARFFTLGALRGFAVGTTYRTDSIALYNPWVSPDIENKERVEVVTGLSGFFSGVGNVGGTIDYIHKRPTAQRLANITLGLNGGTNAYALADLGGMFDEAGRFGYRVNVMGQTGDTNVNHQSIDKTFGSVAFDWNVTDDLQLQIDGSISDYKMKGSDPYWDSTVFGSLAEMPSAPKADRFYGQPWTFTKTKQHHVGARASWKINDIFQVRAGVLRHEAELNLVAANNGLYPTGDEGDYTVYAPTFKYPDTKATGGYAYMHAHFETGFLSHQMTAGYHGNSDSRTNFSGTFQFYPGVYSYNDPTPVLPAPDPFDFVTYKQASASNDNLVIADQIGIGERWTALVGLNHSKIKQRQFAPNGAVVDGSRYSDDDVTPSYALLYRITPSISVYGNYMEGLERGGTAGATFNGQNVVNAGASMPPLISDQVEVGLKAQLGRTLMTAALFEINKGLEYYDAAIPTAPVYVQDGRQVHRGFELTLTGEVTKDLILVSGFTSLDPKIKNNSNPLLIGRRPNHVSKIFGTLYAEYRLPVLPALTFTGGVFHTGKMYVDDANTRSLPSFTSFDLGARYEAEPFHGRPVTFRMNVTNVANDNYWLSGESIGLRRTLLLSATMKLF